MAQGQCQPAWAFFAAHMRGMPTRARPCPPPPPCSALPLSTHYPHTQTHTNSRGTNPGSARHPYARAPAAHAVTARPKKPLDKTRITTHAIAACLIVFKDTRVPPKRKEEGVVRGGMVSLREAEVEKKSFVRVVFFSVVQKSPH